VHWEFFRFFYCGSTLFGLVFYAVKSTATYWNVISSAEPGQWATARGFERTAEELTNGDYANRLLSTMRRQFGGHEEKKAGC
jgi:6-phosphogluconate dehydrogenase (decarboxylating)